MIERNHPEYQKYVKDYDERAYDILAAQLKKGEQVVCPHDPDMIVEKSSQGEVIIHKKSFQTNVFSK